MNNKTRNLLRLIAIIVAALAILIEIGVLNVSAIGLEILAEIRFWLMTIAFALVFLASR